MRLKMEGLFGHFDYDLPLFENGSQVAILTGPNGFGKTTILRCMEALSKGDLLFFFEIRFQVLIFIADDGRCLKIQQNGDKLIFAKGTITPAGESFSTGEEFTFHEVNLFKNKKKSLAYKKLGEKLSAMIEIRQIMREITGEVSLIPFLRLSAKKEEESHYYGDNEDDDDNDDDEDDEDEDDDEDDDDEDEDDEDDDDDFWNLNDFFGEPTDPVEKIPGKIRREISRATQRYNKTSIKLDSQFPSRLLSMTDAEAFSEEEFMRRYKMMGDKLNKLREIGISPSAGLPDNLHYNPQDARALRIILDNFNQKYQEYALLLEKFSLFRRIINDRFLFKSVKISAQQRLIVVDEKKQAAGIKKESLIPLESLSSGEKETLLMFYRLIFETGSENGGKDTLLLIDEPETSLHIVWQHSFMQAVDQISERNHFRTLVATHSPAILNGYEDVQIDLWENQNERRET